MTAAGVFGTSYRLWGTFGDGCQRVRDFIPLMKDFERWTSWCSGLHPAYERLWAMDDDAFGTSSRLWRTLRDGRPVVRDFIQLMKDFEQWTTMRSGLHHAYEGLCAMDVLVFGTSSSLWKTLSNGQRCVRDFITLMKDFARWTSWCSGLHPAYERLWAMDNDAFGTSSRLW